MKITKFLPFNHIRFFKQNTIFALSLCCISLRIDAQEAWPHKGTISIGLGFQVGLNMAGKEIDKIAKIEDSFLKSLGLVEQEMNSSGQVISTKPIDTYDYGDDFMAAGFRGEYFFSDKFALGLHVFFINYTQKLKALDKVGEGGIMNINFVGPSFSYLFPHKGKFGFVFKSDISMVFGKSTSVPALFVLSEQGVLDPISGLSSLVESQHLESNITGFQADVICSVAWYVKYWISFEAGLGAYYYQGKQEKAIWSGVSTSFNSFTPTLNIGANFYLRNK
jgi:hypothetical protein